MRKKRQLMCDWFTKSLKPILKGKLAVILFLAFSFQSIGQEKIPLTGKVMNEQGVPLVGVTILEKGTANGTSTKEDGTFSFSVSKSNSSLLLSLASFFFAKNSIRNNGSIKTFNFVSVASIYQILFLLLHQ